jgi:hypothetical protein
MRPGLLLEKTKKLARFEVVREQVAKTYDLNIPDQVVELSKLRIAPTKEPALDIPGRGVLVLTDWARSQLGILLGITWDKWFKYAKPREVQDEIQKRFRQMGGSQKLRLRRFNRTDSDTGSSGKFDGYVRAVLGPNYSPIDDERIFSRMERSYRSQLNEINFIQNHYASGKWSNDHCSYYNMISNPVNVGAIDRAHPDPAVRRIYDLAEQEGKLPDADWIYPGMQLRNSEVGYTAVIIDEFVFRLVCLNGATVRLASKNLLYRQHRKVEDLDIDKQLGDVFTGLPERWKIVETRMKQLAAIPVSDPVETLDKQLTRMKATKKIIEQAQAAYKLEPLPTMYGIMQAITRVAKEYADMDKQYEIEALGGQLLANAPKHLSAHQAA